MSQKLDFFSMYECIAGLTLAQTSESSRPAVDHTYRKSRPNPIQSRRPQFGRSGDGRWGTRRPVNGRCTLVTLHIKFIQQLSFVFQKRTRGRASILCCVEGASEALEAGARLRTGDVGKGFEIGWLWEEATQLCG